MSRHQPDPGCHLTARPKLSAIVDGRDNRSGNDRADAGQLREPPTRLIRAAAGNHGRVELLDPTIELVQWSRSSPKIARAKSDSSAPATAPGACAMKRHGPCGSTIPYSARRPRVWLIKAVRWQIRRS